MIDPRIPQPVRPTLEGYVSLVEKELPDLLRAFYVVGSIALEGFNERFSDIDFVAVLKRRATPREMATLKSIHQRIEQGFPKWKLSGAYLQEHDLGVSEQEIEPGLYYHDGRFHRAGHFEINPVTWWILKNRGIPVLGDEPAELSFRADWDWLIAWTKENLNTYWAGWATRPDRLLALLSDWGIQWTVLGVLRQYYTLRGNAITTKLKAGEYGLIQVPQRWQPLIQEAIAIREGHKRPHYRSRLARMLEAKRFIGYVIRECIQQ